MGASTELSIAHQIGQPEAKRRLFVVVQRVAETRLGEGKVDGCVGCWNGPLDDAFDDSICVLKPYGLQLFVGAGKLHCCLDSWTCREDVDEQLI